MIIPIWMVMSSSFYVGHNKDMWKTFNPETGTGSLPIWNADNASNSFTQQSDLNLIKASYFSIRNITLGYTLPKNLMQKSVLKSCAFMLQQTILPCGPNVKDLTPVWQWQALTMNMEAILRCV